MQDYLLLYLGAILISMGCGFAAIPAITKFCLKYKLYDQPNGRKIHHQPIPRLGGISFVPGMLLTSLYRRTPLYLFIVRLRLFLIGRERTAGFGA